MKSKTVKRQPRDREVIKRESREMVLKLLEDSRLSFKMAVYGLWSSGHTRAEIREFFMSSAFSDLFIEEDFLYESRTR